MTLSDPVRSTLRVLMSPPRLLRTNICAFHHPGSSVSNIALELWSTRNGGYSILEMCREGELQAGQEIGLPAGATDAVLDDDALCHAMQILWAGTPEHEAELSQLASIRTTSLLLAEQGDDCFKVVQSWYYRERSDQCLLDVWSDDSPTRTHEIARPTGKSLRARVAELQAVACRLKA